MEGSKDGKFPYVPENLLLHMEKLIPEMCPTLDQSERDIFHYAGQRAIVRLLRQVFNEQNEVT